MISKNFLWFCIFVVSFVAAVLNFVHSRWFVFVLMGMVAGFSLAMYLDYRVKER